MQRQNYAIFNENDLNFMDCNKYLMPFKLMPVHLNCICVRFWQKCAKQIWLLAQLTKKSPIAVCEVLRFEFVLKISGSVKSTTAKLLLLHIWQNSKNNNKRMTRVRFTDRW